MLGRIYNVVESMDFFNEAFDYYMYYGNTLAVHYGVQILPVFWISNIMKQPGIYYDGLGWQIITYDPESDMTEYSDARLARLGDADTFQELLVAKQKLYEDEYNHLVNNDDIFIPHMDQNEDTALMYAVKAGTAAKKCNINNYAERFGGDFNNDKRKFNGTNITAGKAESILSNLDVRVTLVLQDMRPDVANPIGKALVLPWIGDGINDDAYVNYINDAITAKGPIKL